MYWIVIHARNSVFYITTTSFVDHFGRRRSSPLLWKVLLIQPILVVGGGLSKWLDLLMCIWGRSHIESKINFDSLFGKPHVGGPCSVCQGGQHSLFCLQSWNALHFLWTPDRQLACVWGLMCVKNVSLNTRVPLRSEVCTSGRSTVGCNWLRELRRDAAFSSLPHPGAWGHRVGWLARVYMSASLLRVGVTEFFWEKACVMWQRLPWCQIFTHGEVLLWDPPVILLVNTHCESRVEEAEQRNVLFWN